jgi:DNA-damage-inducible protein D
MAEQLNLFHLDGDRPGFEDLGHENGGKYWYARDLAKMLGYESFQAFQKPINKALATCTALNIPVIENIVQVQRVVDGAPLADFRLSRFACYLVAINGDVRKREVAEAQAYFVTMAEAFRQFIQGAENVERVQIRDKVSEQEISLASTAAAAGVTNYPFFQDSGYRGMYNMHLNQLRLVKGVQQDRSVLDFMGPQELAGNLFRITQTEAKIQNENLRGQRSLEKAAMDVGRTVRGTMIQLSGKAPEELPPGEDIRQVKGKLKQTRKEFGKLDRPKRKALAPPKS